MLMFQWWHVAREQLVDEGHPSTGGAAHPLPQLFMVGATRELRCKRTENGNYD
jgi:hypothetical protein